MNPSQKAILRYSKKYFDFWGISLSDIPKYLEVKLLKMGGGRGKNGFKKSPKNCLIEISTGEKYIVPRMNLNLGKQI